MTASAPSFDRITAAATARERWGIEGELDSLPSERDQNFRIAATTGETYVLKISQAGESRALLECQTELLERLASAAAHAGVREPMHRFAFGRCIASQAGSFIETVTRDDGTPHFVRLLTFVPGIPLAAGRPHEMPLLRDVGRLIGSVGKALDAWDHPGAHRELHWDLRHAPDVITKYLPAIDSRERIALVEHFLRGIEREAASFRSLRSGVIHGDANDWNVLISGVPTPRHTSPDISGADTHSAGAPAARVVTGLVDAGDVVHSWRIGDLAIACAYGMLDRQDPLEAASQIAGGCNEVDALPREELDALFPLIHARLCTSVVLSAHQRALRPDNEYLSVSEAPAWRLLEQLLEVQPAMARDAFQSACGVEPPESALERSTRSNILARREASIGRALSIAYRTPLVIVRGRGQYLYDEHEQQYLDAVNNVAHVGHSHPRVVEALVRQARQLNTNTRYLHELLVRYAERLTATLPDPLCVCWFTCSGSEANELALRMARTHTGREDVIVLDAAYHGNTTSLIAMSPYKLNGPGGHAPPPWVHVAPLPDPYRGIHRGHGTDAGSAYAAEVQTRIERMMRAGRAPAAFFAEPLPGCGGQIVPPDGFLREAFDAVRAAGGVCIADEVQTGLGRVGSHFWAFETQNAIPDIVTIGKPIGNGHPLGAVVTTRAIADSFDNGMEYFNTFGGNPVSCAVGLAVLDVIEDERLADHALRTGARLMSGLRSLMDRHPAIGDVRGLGLYIGVELVRDRASRQPDGALASDVADRMREHHILLSTDGPDHNVLKIKPPLVFDLEDADRFIDTLDRVLDIA